MSFFDPSLAGRLLRDPAAIAQDCKTDRDLPRIAASAIATIVAGAVAFGAAVGAWQGGAQIAFAAIKITLVSVGTLAVCVPAFYAILAAFGRPLPLRTTISTMLVAGARSSLVLLAAAPVVWLITSLGAPYDVVKLLAALAYALGGLAALGLLLRSIGAGPDRAATIATVIGIFLLVGGQAAWVLRPYLGNPDRGPVTFFTHEREGGLAYQLYVSARHVLSGHMERGDGS